MDNARGQWGSKFGFLMAAIGSAVGLGNLWGFPYKMGANGGFAFLLVYLLFALFGGVVIGLLEMAIGRRTQKSPILAIATLGKRYRIVGWMSVACGFIILSFYSTIGGYCLKYIISYIGEIFGAGFGFHGASGSEFIGALLADPVQSIGYHLLFMAITVGIVMFGVEGGIEKFSKIAMPALLVMMLIVIGKGLSMPGSSEGLAFMFKWDFSVFTDPEIGLMSVVRSAAGQMMFSLSLGMGILITYGSYLPKEYDLTKNAIVIPIADTIFAILAGLCIMPVVFALGIDPKGGPMLLFETLHNVFGAMGRLGPIFGLFFFLLTAIAAITSAIALLEGCTSSWLDAQAEKGRNGNRKLCTLVIGLLIFLLGVPVALDGLGSNGLVQPLGMVWLDFYDFITEGLMMPLSALLMCIIIGWRKGIGWIEEEITLNGNVFYGKTFFTICIKYITPILMAFALVSLALSYFGL